MGNGERYGDQAVHVVQQLIKNYKYTDLLFSLGQVVQNVIHASDKHFQMNNFNVIDVQYEERRHGPHIKDTLNFMIH